ncbi:MAG: GAF domain-containing protein [Anaerolineae bacterium]|nr:GAF domain-containing protein [Anaerolineae bacterium]
MAHETFEHFIGDLALLCQRSTKLTWQSLLHETLVLFSKAAHASQAVLILLDEQQQPLYCAHSGGGQRDGLCAKLPAVLQAAGGDIQGVTEVQLPDATLWALSFPPTNCVLPSAYLIFAGITQPPPKELLELGAALSTPLMQNVRFHWQARYEIPPQFFQTYPFLADALRSALVFIGDELQVSDVALLLFRDDYLDLVAGTGRMRALEGQSYEPESTPYHRVDEATPIFYATHYEDMTLLSGTQGVLVALITVAQEPLGLVWVEFDKPEILPSEVQYPFSQLVRALPSLIDAHRSAFWQQKLMDRHRFLSVALRELSTYSDVDQILSELGRITLEVMDADHMAVLAPDDKGGLVCHYQHNGFDSCVEFVKCFHTLHSEGEFLSSNDVIQIVDAWNETAPLGDIAKQAGFHSTLLLLLRIVDRFLGIIAICRNDVRPFSVEEVGLGMSLAGQAGLVLNNLYLFEREREQRVLAESLADAAAVLAQSLELEQILDQIIEQLGRVIPHDASNLMLIEGEWAKVVRWWGYERFGVEQEITATNLSVHWPLFKQMIETRSAVVLSDTRGSDKWIARENFEWLSSYASAPIIVGNEVFGFINVDSATPGFFNESYSRWLKAFADHAAIALQNARFYEKSQRRTQEIATLYTVATIFSTTLDFHEALQKIIECLITPLDVDTIWIALPPETGSTRRWTYVFESMGKQGAGAPYPELYRQTLERRTVSDLIVLESLITGKRGQDIAYYLGVPLLSGERALGVLNLGWYNFPHAMDDAYKALLEALGQQIGTGLDRILLFREAQQRQAYQESLNAVISVVNQAESLDKILSLGLEQALKVLNLESGVIYLRTTQEQLLELRVERGGKVRPRPYNRAGEGIIGRAFVEQRVLVEPALDLDAAASQVQVSGIEISLPLLAEGQPVGVMALASSRARKVHPEELQLLRAIADQLAFAVQRGQLSAQLKEQLQGLHVLYEISAAFLSHLGSSSVLFVLLRTLSDLLAGTLAIAFYTFQHNDWLRTRVYVPPRNRKNENLTGTIRIGNGRPGYDDGRQNLKNNIWPEGVVWDSECELLEACRHEQMLVLVSDQRGNLPAFWPVMQSVGVQQLLYFPIVLPKNEFFGAIGVLLSEDRLLTPQELALAWAIIRQAAAALARVRLYEATREGESRLRAILESSQDGVFLVGTDLCVRYVNQRALDLLQLAGPPAAWEGRSLPEAIAAIRHQSHPLARCLAQLARHVRIPGGLVDDAVLDHVFQTTHGPLLTLQHWLVYSEREQRIGGLFMLHDVTEQHMLEQMRDDLLHMLVHDMRNPLTAILSAIQMLEDPALEGSEGEILDIARVNSQRVLRLVNEILEIGRLESGRVILQEEPVLFPDLLKRVTGDEILHFPRPSLQLEVPDDLPILWIDRGYVDRVFQNILDNAAKFIPEKDGVVKISASGEGAWLKVAIYNNGPHIPPVLMKRLFDKFVAGEYSGRGYGLGLAFCRLVVNSHGGRIWAYNEPEGGVTFYFTLPIVPEFEDL